MLAGQSFTTLGIIVLACLPATAVMGAEPAPDAITVQVGAAPPASMTAADLATLPAVQLSVTFSTEHGLRHATFEGPLLWTVLNRANGIDPAKPGEQVRQIVTLTGHDGYTAVLGLGELSPDFEGKQVILADRMDGKPLGPDHLRVVVPGDKRGGRSVRDIVRLAVGPAPQPPH